MDYFPESQPPSPPDSGPPTPDIIAEGEAVSSSANVVLIVLSFLAPLKPVSAHLLHRGATARKRWDAQGDIVEVDAPDAGIAENVYPVLSNLSTVYDAFHDLSLAGAVVETSPGCFDLNELVATRVRGLSPECFTAWKRQALLLTCRAIPWKYLEPKFPIDLESFLPHLQHAIHAFEDDFDKLSVKQRYDITLSLIEASRFSDMEWKRFVLEKAERVSQGIEDEHLRYRFAEARSILSCASRDIENAASIFSDFGQNLIKEPQDQAMNAVIGSATIQRSLVCIETEDLDTAKSLLELWSSLKEDLSPAEEAVAFRKDMVLGRILRLQGAFVRSLAQLETARISSKQRTNLVFDEDLDRLMCDLADTLRELNDPVSSERHLQQQLERMVDHDLDSWRCSEVELALAEAYFAQKKYDKAEINCQAVRTRAPISRYEMLRLHVILAKSRHIQSDHAAALVYWGQALGDVRKLQPGNEHFARIITVSLCDAMMKLGQTWLSDGAREQNLLLQKNVKPGFSENFIAGTRQWKKYILETTE